MENKIKAEEKPKKDVKPARSMDTKQASEAAKKKLAEALNKKANNTVAISKEGNEWIASVEIIEEQYLPGMNIESMNDTLAVYEVKLSSTGELISWNKKSSHKRGETI